MHGAQARSELGVGSATVCSPGPHNVCELQAVSWVELPRLLTNCSTLQMVCGLHSRSEVGVAGWAMNSSAGQVALVTLRQTASFVAEHGVASYSVIG